MKVGFNSYNYTYNNIPQRTKYVSPSFTSRKTEIPAVIDFLRKQPNLKCAYCGEIMITNDELEKFVKKVSEHTDRDLLDCLREHRSLMKENEREICNYICRALEEFPRNDLSLEDILNKMLPYHKERILDRQIIILNNIQNFSKSTSITAHDGAIIKKFVTEKLNEIAENKEVKNNEENKNNILNPKYYLTDLFKIRYSFDDPNSFSKVKEELLKMPSSNTSVDAFVVEYAGKTSSEIATRLLSPSLITIEHLITQSEGKKNDNPEIYKEKNMVLTCSQCNSIRGNSSINKMSQIKIYFWHYVRSIRSIKAAVSKKSDKNTIRDYIEAVKVQLSNLLNGGLNLYINTKA